MIHVDRKRVAAPAALKSPTVRALKAAVADFHTRRQSSRRQERAEFPLLPEPEFEQVLGRLRELFHGKCAYCETELRGEEGVDRFRPKAGALGLHRDFWPDHYWWLAYEWENLYAACGRCNQIKGPKFPVVEKRIRIRAIGGALKREQRLLIDPCLDEPAEDLEFLDDGTVVPLSQRGDVTIQALELNRPALVKERRFVAVETLDLLSRMPRAARKASGPWSGPLDKVLEALAAAAPGRRTELVIAGVRRVIAPDYPHAAVTRAVVARWVDKMSRPHGGAAKPARAVVLASRQTRLRTHVLTGIELRGFRGLARLELQIPQSERQVAPWVVLLGENGTGKSSILQAIAVVLAGEAYVLESGMRPAGALRHGAPGGWVRVRLSGAEESIGIRFERGARKLAFEGVPPRRVVLAYGATRLLPRGSNVGSATGRVRLRNLFDPFRPLVDADQWLGRLKPPARFDYVARALKDVLDLPRSSRLKKVRRRGRKGVQLALHGTPLSLEQLSDGYQSVLGLTCDIIAGLMSGHEGALEAAEGTVLIDELGTHLHPRWRMNIVRSLRKAFPRVQFIVSTHDPLCLRGLEDGEVVVLRRTARGRIYSVPDLPPIKGMRVDQLLTSEYFGLQSSMDPEIEAQANELYRLLAMRTHTPAQEKRVRELREFLNKHELPGTTRRERRLLELIDLEFAATDNEPDTAERQKLKERTNSRIAADLGRLLRRS